MHFYDLPRRYSKERIKGSDLKDNPFEQLLDWITSAQQEGVTEINAMSLATASMERKPSCRTVLLKLIDEKGLVFFTNYESRKAKEIDENPYAMVTFFWHEVMRQICIEGKVEKISTDESLAYFSQRPRNSQLSAWASPQDQVIASYNELEDRFKKMEVKFRNQTIPLPPFWGGFRILPHRFEFWNGGMNRLHDRFQYTLDRDVWIIERLAP